MHHYQFHIGDYISHTGHLTVTEDLAYRRMIDWYYLHETPLPDDIEKISKLIRMREHCKCIASVLQEFFVLKNDEYRHERIDNEIKNYKSLVKTRKKSANARWAKRGKALGGDASALQMECKSNANRKPETVNQEPVTSNQETPDAKRPDCPHLEIIKLYNETLPELQQVIPSRWSGVREKSLRARWREDERHQTMEFWKWFFGCVSKSDWHMGRSTNWQADLGWLVKAENFTKLLERFVNDSSR